MIEILDTHNAILNISPDQVELMRICEVSRSDETLYELHINLISGTRLVSQAYYCRVDSEDLLAFISRARIKFFNTIGRYREWASR